MVLLTYELLFGVGMCSTCPGCNRGCGDVWCQGLFGSSVKAEGGILGRIDAEYISVEAQKGTGSLHAHSQLLVRCLRHHTPLHEILTPIRRDGNSVVQAYVQYKAHKCRQLYAGAEVAVQKGIDKSEAAWPEYKTAI